MGNAGTYDFMERFQDFGSKIDEDSFQMCS